MGTVYVLRDGELVEKNKARLTLACGAPYVVSDHLDGILNPVDGRRYDSKSRYYRAVREAGCEIVGNEKLPLKTPEFRAQGVGQDVKRAIEELRSR